MAFLYLDRGIYFLLALSYCDQYQTPQQVSAFGVCVATCGLEFLQLWQPPFLQAARATLPGRMVLGNSFTWSDFPSYFAGSFLGWVWVRWLTRLNFIAEGRRQKAEGRRQR